MATNLGEFRVARKSALEPLSLAVSETPAGNVSATKEMGENSREGRKSTEEPNWKVKVSKSVSEIVQMTSEPLLSLRVKRSDTVPPVWYTPTQEEPSAVPKFEFAKIEPDKPKPEENRNSTPKPEENRNSKQKSEENRNSKQKPEENRNSAQKPKPEENRNSIQKSKSEEKPNSTDEEGEVKERSDKVKNEYRKLLRFDVVRSSSDSEASSKEDVTDPPRCSSDHSDGTKVADFTLPTDVYTLFTTIFTNSKFFNAFQTRRETSDLILGDWTEDGTQTFRTNTFTVKLAQRIGPKHAKVKEKQTLLPVSKPGFLYAINMESSNSEIPHADSFYLTFHMCLSRIAPKETRMVVVADLKFRKAVWGPIKSIIEKGSWAGIANYYADLEASLKKEFAETKVETVLPSQENSQGTARRRPLRKKRPAPSIPTTVSAQTIERNKTGIFGFFGFPSRNSLKSQFALKVFLCVLALLLLGFNTFLFIRVQELEAEIELNFSKSDSFIQADNGGHLQELFFQRQSFRELAHSRFYKPIGMAIEKLRQVEEEIRSLKNLVNIHSS